MLHPNIYYNNDTKQIRWNEIEKTAEDFEDFIDQADDDELEKIRIQVNRRKNQSKFRNSILKLYNNMCAISGTEVTEVLDAAHIISHSKSGINQKNNGILLRSDLHLLFDKNLLQIDPVTCEVLIDKSLKDSIYYTYHKSKLDLPISDTYLLKKYKDFA